MLTKNEAQALLNTLSEGDKAILYDKGCFLFFDSGNDNLPWSIQTAGDCFADTVGRYETYEEALGGIQKLSNTTIRNWEERVW